MIEILGEHTHTHTHTHTILLLIYLTIQKMPFGFTWIMYPYETINIPETLRLAYIEKCTQLLARENEHHNGNIYLYYIVVWGEFSKQLQKLEN